MTLTLKRLALVGSLMLATQGHAASTVFEDGFADGSTARWSFLGVNASAWDASARVLQSSLVQTAHHPSGPEFAVINGVTTSSHFKIEADVQVVGAPLDHDANWGHVGFFWGMTGSKDFSIGYLRTHSDVLTAWYSTGSFEALTPLGFDAVDGPAYHLSYEVDYGTRTMTMQLGGVTGAFTGADFDKVNQQAGVGGRLGVISWGERVAYDNVKVTDFNAAVVPEPDSWVLMLAGLGVVGALARRRRA